MNLVARLIGPISISQVFSNLCPRSSINLGRRILDNRSTDVRIDNLLKIEINRPGKFASCRAWTFLKPENLGREQWQSLDWTPWGTGFWSFMHPHEPYA
jgi:hypothetical protein